MLASQNRLLSWELKHYIVSIKFNVEIFFNNFNNNGISYKSLTELKSACSNPITAVHTDEGVFIVKRILSQNFFFYLLSVCSNTIYNKKKSNKGVQ